MTTRFNPPPGWPSAGLGALPRADWEPGPGAPPAPPHWPFYVDDRGYVTTPPPGAWQPTTTVLRSAEPPAAPAPGRHRRARRRPRWSPLVVALPVTVVSAIVVLLGILAVVGL